DVELFATTVDALQDQFDLTAAFENRETLDRLTKELKRQGMHDVLEMVPMMLRDADAEEMIRRFGKSRNTLSGSFALGAQRRIGPPSACATGSAPSGTGSRELARPAVSTPRSEGAARAKAPRSTP